MQNYTVGIVTYVERFEKWFKPLLRTIKEQRPNVEIIVCINGEHNKEFNQDYRRDILEYIAKFNNVFPIMMTTHRSLSKLWNNLLINASNNILVRLNDHLIIPNDSFWTKIETSIRDSDGRSFKINGSWSHTVLNRREIESVGWFDERYLGAGEEDGDMEWRWAEGHGQEFLNISGFPIDNNWNNVDFEKCLVNLRKYNGKRSLFNREFNYKKYERDDDHGVAHGMMYAGGKKLRCVLPTENQYPYERFFWENKDNL